MWNHLSKSSNKEGRKKKSSIVLENHIVCFDSHKVIVSIEYLHYKQIK